MSDIERRTNNTPVGVENLFKRRGSILNPNENAFIDKWGGELLQITNKLAHDQSRLLPDVANEARRALRAYLIHSDHGAHHSYFVYEGMRWLAEKEKIKIDDADLQAVAVLHDLAQMLPYKDPKTGDELGGDQRASHPETMAQIIYLFAPLLHLDEHKVREVMIAIRHHDDTYGKKNAYKYMGQLGKLLAESDKLFGGGMSREPKEMAHDAIIRNQQGADNPQGWYLMRDDLSPEQRNNWKYGDRWIGDRISAVRKDMFKTEFYTESGKQIAEQRRSIFIEQAKIAYGAEYDATQEALKNWRLSLATDASAIVSLVGKNPNGKDPQVEQVTQDEEINTVVDRAYKKDLGVKTREGFPATRGWKIQISIGNEKPIILDPSIARFSTREEFLKTLVSAFTN